MNTKNKAIAGILIVTVVLAGVAIAVSAEGEPGIRAILPGSITAEHIGPDAVGSSELIESEIFTMAGLIDTGTLSVVGATKLNDTIVVSGKELSVQGATKLNDTIVVSEKELSVQGATKLNDTIVVSEKELSVQGTTKLNGTTITAGQIFSAEGAIVNLGINQVNESELAGNAIPNSTVYNETEVATTNETFSYWDTFKTQIELPRAAKLIIFWTADNAWGTVSPYNLSVNCTVNSSATEGFVASAYPRDVVIADQAYNNLSSTVVFYTDTISAQTVWVQVQIKQTGGGLVGVKKSATSVIALPA